MINYNGLSSIYNSPNSRYNAGRTQRLNRLVSRLGNRPIVLDQDRNQIAVLENSFDVILEQEVAGMDELSISIPLSDSKRPLITNESHLQVFDTIYVIREIIDFKRKGVTEVFAEATWYDLQYADILDVTEWDSALASTIMADTLKGTGWSVGRVEYTNRRTLDVDISKNRLEVLSNVESLFSGELVFDTQLQTVSLLKPEGKHTGASVTFDKNASDIEAYYDTKDLITKIYAYGKNEMTISDANNGIPYVENYSYTDKPRVRTVKDERFTNPYHLKEVVVDALDTMAKPRASYTIKMAELSNRAGLEHEQFDIGGLVRFYDKELNVDLNTRIMKWKYNVIEPQNTDLTLESKAKTLSDLLSGADGFGDRVTSGDSVEKDEMLDLNVFNYLLNSRADDGMAYWESKGWVVDSSKGSSGGASFKAVGERGESKELYQTVYPSSHDSYTLSFRADTQSLDVSSNGRAGVELRIKYDDGSEGTEFVSLT